MIILLRNIVFCITNIFNFTFIICIYNSIQKHYSFGFRFNDYKVNIEIILMITTVLINIVIAIYHIIVIPVII